MRRKKPTLSFRGEGFKVKDFTFCLDTNIFFYLCKRREREEESVETKGKKGDMKRAANKTGGGGGGGFMAADFESSSSSLFSDLSRTTKNKNPRCVCVLFFPLCGRQLVRFTRKNKAPCRLGLIKSIKFVIYLIRRIKRFLFFPSQCIITNEGDRFLDFVCFNE